LRQSHKDRVLAERRLQASQPLPRFGYRRTAVWLALGLCRVRRLWRQLGLQLPRRRPRRRRCGTDIQLPGAVQPNAVWSYDFVHDRLANGRAGKTLS
jgi:transposase InsO family protein